MKKIRCTGSATALIAAVLVALPASGQDQEAGRLPLGPLRPAGDLVAPFFDGWYANEDGSYTLSYGFLNRNLEEDVYIPLGENNHIEPAEFDGVQPTFFPVYNRPGFIGKRERGAFAVTIPPEMAGTDVVWTISHAGRSYSIPGRTTSAAYELSHNPAAAGSLPPLLRFGDGPEVFGREGVYDAPITAKVGEPVRLSVGVHDRGMREEGALVPVNTTWIRHQGPAAVSFEPESARFPGDEWSESATQATFSEPGAYMIRVRVDNFTTGDSSFDDQCCWSNGFVRVTVTE